MLSFLAVVFWQGGGIWSLVIGRGLGVECGVDVIMVLVWQGFVMMEEQRSRGSDKVDGGFD